MENKTDPYKKISHFKDMLTMNNEPNIIPTYTDKQFKEDLQKWINKPNIIPTYTDKQFKEDLQKWINKVTIARDLKG